MYLQHSNGGASINDVRWYGGGGPYADANLKKKKKKIRSIFCLKGLQIKINIVQLMTLTMEMCSFNKVYSTLIFKLFADREKELGGCSFEGLAKFVTDGGVRKIVKRPAVV